MNEQVMLDEVMRYLNDDTYNYALMIDGKWGVGKTHFTTKTLTEYLKNCSEKENQFSVRYYSVCGCSTLREFKENIAYDLLKRKAKEIPEIVDEEIEKKRAEREAKNDSEATLSEDSDNENKVKPKKHGVLEETEEKVREYLDNHNIKKTQLYSMGIDLGSKVISGLLKSKIPVVKTLQMGDFITEVDEVAEHIFIFDDIERCTFSVYDLLCFINELVEKVSCKVIILINEDALKKTEPKFRQYMQIKEKVVGSVLEYKPDIREIFRKLAEANFEEGSILRKLTIDNIDRFVETMAKKSHHSLRTFQFFLSKIKNISAFIDRIGEEQGITLTEEQYRIIVRAALAMSFDFKNEMFNYDGESEIKLSPHRQDLSAMERYIRTGILDEEAFAAQLKAL